MNRCGILLCLCGLVVLAACKRDDQIQTYRVSKESDMPTPSAPVMPTDAPPQPDGRMAMPQGDAPSSDVAPSAPGGDMSAMGAQMGMTAAATTKDISWTVPSGWKELPASAMRVGSFQIQGAN